MINYINSMTMFAEKTRNVHKELKDTLKNTKTVMKQYIKIRTSGQNAKQPTATKNTSTQTKDVLPQEKTDRKKEHKAHTSEGEKDAESDWQLEQNDNYPVLREIREIRKLLRTAYKRP